MTDTLSAIYEKIKSAKQNGEKYISLDEFGFLGYKKLFHFYHGSRPEFRCDDMPTLKCEHKKIIEQLEKEGYEIFFSSYPPGSDDFYERSHTFKYENGKTSTIETHGSQFDRHLEDGAEPISVMAEVLVYLPAENKMTDQKKMEVLAKNQMAIKDALNFLFNEFDVMTPDDIDSQLNGEGGVDDSLRQAFPNLF